jgi:hypothetical protein
MTIITEGAKRGRPSFGRPRAVRGLDLFDTPPIALEPLFEHEPLLAGVKVICEPFAGRGNLVTAMRRRGITVHAADILDRGCPDCAAQDFFAAGGRAGCGVLVSNPPYSRAMDAIEHALGLGFETVIFLLKVEFLCSATRYERLHKSGHLRRVHVLAERLQGMHDANYEGRRASQPLMHAWFVIERGYRGPAIINPVSMQRPAERMPWGGVMTPTILEAAAFYHDEKGWMPVPVSRRAKSPFEDDWQNLLYSPERFRGTINIGLQFGPRSGNLVDVDVDSALAVALADKFLPPTGAVYGRASKPRSHRLYIADFESVGKRAAFQFKDGTLMIVELRIGAKNAAAQSVAPPSVHTSGEAIEWVNGCDPAPVDGRELHRAVRQLAAACLLVAHYPGENSRHEGAMTLGGVLARAGVPDDAIASFMEIVAEAAGDDEVEDRVAAAKGAVDLMARGQHAPGLIRFADVWKAEVANAFIKWKIVTPDVTESDTVTGGVTGEGLPVLKIDPGDLTQVAKELATMFAERERFLSNGNEPVQVVGGNHGMPKAAIVTHEAVCVYAHELCVPMKPNERGRLVRVTLTPRIANLYLNGLQGEWGLRNFTGITTAPILGADGSIRTGCGYDEATGLWCHNIPDVDVPERPTEDDAKASLAALRWEFRTFAFADAKTVGDAELGVDVVNPEEDIGFDESTYLAGLMTAVCRASLELAPGIIATAPAFSGAGTGKGLGMKAICIVASGAAPSAFTSGHDEKEFDKRLTSALIEARPAIFLDNYNSKDLSSDILASALTENPCEVRPFGTTSMVRLHNHTLITVTGNAVTIAEDQVRRWLKIELDAKCENPELRPFKPGFLDGIYRARSALLGHALTIWRWGRQNAREMRVGKALGSYEVWAQWCRDPLLTLGCRDPVERIAASKTADPRRKHVLAVYEAWWRDYQDKPILAKDLGYAVTGAIDQKARWFGSEYVVSRQYVASWLARHVGTRMGGYVLMAEADEGAPSKQIHKYRLDRLRKDAVEGTEGERAKSNPG